MQDEPYRNRIFNEVYHKTAIICKPVSGIVSGYHELRYILVSPNEENPANSTEITGKINVSPKFILTPEQMGETFGDVFDPETFSDEIQGRLFSFVYASKRNVKIENQDFAIAHFEEKAEERINRVHDNLLMQENIRTGLIFGPQFKYYPISIDRFIGEIIDREFKV
jgi:hypothetical protein